jgi:enoyl-CoA hydratase/carnithine racemase
MSSLIIEEDGPVLRATMNRPERLNAGSLEAVVAMEDRNQTLCPRDPDFAEGLTSFLEERSPVYRGL